jgi:hypothetical protein
MREDSSCWAPEHRQEPEERGEDWVGPVDQTLTSTPIRGRTFPFKASALEGSGEGDAKGGQASPLLWIVPCASAPPLCSRCGGAVDWADLGRTTLTLSIGAGGAVLCMCHACAWKSLSR